MYLFSTGKKYYIYICAFCQKDFFKTTVSCDYWGFSASKLKMTAVDKY